MFQRTLAFRALIASLACSAPLVAKTAPDILPLRRVRLYEAGVGYFERSGPVGPSTRLSVPRSHLDDALMTLVILDNDGSAKVSGVELDQPTTWARNQALAGLHRDSDEYASFDTYLRSLVGTDVEVSLASGRAQGKLLEVMRPEDSGLSRCVRAEGVGGEARGSDPICKAQSGFLLMTPTGEVLRHATADVKSIRPLDGTKLDRLRGAAVPKGRAASEQALDVKLHSGSSITLGYVAEAPLWRASYRLLLDPSGPVLQGWALIHNDTEEAWRGIRLELVNGMPDSFLFPMSAPRYVTRRLVTPEEHIPSVPQLLDDTADDAWDGGVDRGEGIGLGAFGSAGQGTAGGGLANAVSADPGSSVLKVGNLAAQDPTEGRGVGALFRYALGQSIDLAPKKSLLAPFLREKISAERVAWFEAPDKAAKSTIVMTNTSSQTIPPGTIALFEGGGFAGESAIDRWEPSVRRLVHFGVDLDVALEARDPHESEELRLLAFDGSTLTEHYLRRTDREYTVVNRGAVSRKVHLRLAVVNNARITGADDVYVDGKLHTADAVFTMPAAQRKTYAVRAEEGLERSLPANEIDSVALQKFFAMVTLPSGERAAIERAIPFMRRHEEILRTRARLQGKLGRLDERLNRLASTLEIVRRADSDQGERQARLLVDGETERARLRAELDALSPYPALAAAKRELAALKAK